MTDCARLCLLLLALAAPARAGEKAAPALAGESRRLEGILRFGRDIEVGAQDLIEGPVVVFDGSVSVSGKVEGPVVAFGGSVALRPGSRVEGPVLSFGGRSAADEKSVVEGPVLEFPSGVPWRELASAVAPLLAAFGSFWLLYKVLSTLSWMAVALLCGVLFPRALENTRLTIDRRPGLSAAAGLLFWPVLATAFMALLISLLGIPLLPLLSLAAVAAWFWGFSALGLWLGEKVSSGLWRKPLLSVLAGTALLGILGMIPLLRWAACLGVGVWGVGAALLSLFGARTPPAKA